MYLSRADNSMTPGILVIIPALNEEMSIGRVIADIPRDLVSEVVVTDNGSTDRTAEIAADAGATVLREERRGYGYACMKGIHYALSKPDGERPGHRRIPRRGLLGLPRGDALSRETDHRGRLRHDYRIANHGRTRKRGAPPAGPVRERARDDAHKMALRGQLHRLGPLPRDEVR